MVPRGLTTVLRWPAFPPTPAAVPGRVGALDVVRSWSLIVVVLGHFLMQIQYWPQGGLP